MTKYESLSRNDLIKEIKFLRVVYERRYVELKYFQDLHLKSLKPLKKWFNIIC